MSRPTLLEQLEATLPPTRLADLAAQKRRELETVLLLDVSGSMLSYADPDGRSTRMDALRRVLADLDLDCPRIDFGGLEPPPGVRRLHAGEPLPQPAGGTPLGAALDLAREYTYRRAIIVSDGEPNDPGHARRAAQAFGRRIDAFYVGYAGGQGETFLRELVTASGGAMNTISLAEPAQLEAGLRGLLTAGEDARVTATPPVARLGPRARVLPLAVLLGLGVLVLTLLGLASR